MELNNELVIANEEIENMIHIVRGQKVMLDFELAKFYGYETRTFNQQVKNNIEKFDETFRFQLTKEEWDEILRSKNLISSWGGNRYIPYAFTEQGIYMLMTVLKGDLATKQSISLIKAFKVMKDYIISNQNFITVSEFIELSAIVHDNTRKITVLQDNDDILFKKFNDVIVPKHYLILNGNKIEGDVAYQTIYESACHSIIIVDDYVNIKTLQLLKSAKNNVSITLITDNKAKNGINSNFVNDFNLETKNSLVVIQNNNRFHDRYIMVDLGFKTEALFLCGSSSKDAGNKITTIVKIEDVDLYRSIFEQIISN